MACFCKCIYFGSSKLSNERLAQLNNVSYFVVSRRVLGCRSSQAGYKGCFGLWKLQGLISFKAAQPVGSPAVETEVGTGHWAGRGAKALQGLADGQGSFSRAKPQGKAWLQ